MPTETGPNTMIWLAGITLVLLLVAFLLLPLSGPLPLLLGIVPAGLYVLLRVVKIALWEGRPPIYLVVASVVLLVSGFVIPS